MNGAPPVGAEIPSGAALRTLLHQPGGTLGSGLLVVIAIAALAAPLASEATTVGAILHGWRASIGFGLLSCVLALVIGGGVGLGAAYAGGRGDVVAMRAADLQRRVPALFVALLWLAAWGPGTRSTLLALCFVQWPGYALCVRNAARVARESVFVEAARGLGLGAPRIVARHVLPHCIALLLSRVPAGIVLAVALEATLSFLGLGLDEGEPSLGHLVAAGFAQRAADGWLAVVLPGVALAALLLALHLVADALARGRCIRSGR